MFFKHFSWSIWVITGLSLSLFVLGGLGTIQIASSSVPETPSSISTISALGSPAAQVTQTPNVEMKTYVVEPGDTLWSIAVKFYGNGAKYTLIQRANALSDNTLRTGQVISIPFSETEKTLPPQTSVLVATTPSPVPSQGLPTPTVSPSRGVSGQPAVTTTPTAVSNLAVTPTDPGLASAIPMLGVVINVLGVICLLGSIMCAIFSYDLYRRSRHYARRRYISNRVRTGL